MRMTSVVCNVPVLSQNDSTYQSSFCLHDMKVASLRYLDAKFHHPSLGASPPNRGNRISCIQNSRKTENRNSVNNSGIGILCSKNSNERLAFPAVAGLLVYASSAVMLVRHREGIQPVTQPSVANPSYVSGLTHIN